MNIILVGDENCQQMYCKIRGITKANKYLLYIVLLISVAAPAFSQEQRLADKNTIGWLVYIGTFQVKPAISLHTEYQWRRVDGFNKWQQSLLRGGITFHVRKDVSIQAGYAFAESFPYGDYPVTFSFPEHRIYEQVVLKNPIGKMDISHRFTLEQRFVGTIKVDNNNQKNTDWTYLNRIRYRLRTELPISTKGWSVAIQDEVFIGWGRNAGANIFDQNRLAVLLGYRLNQKIKFEAGYLNQILQQGKRVDNKPVFQYNNGFMIASYLSFDFS